jgi:serine/threonine protein kinase/CRP-like cAMP-binding protein
VRFHEVFLALTHFIGAKPTTKEHHKQMRPLLQKLLSLSESTLTEQGWVQQSLPRSQFLFKQEEPAEVLYVIKRGALDILLDGILIDEIGAGECLGESSVFFLGEARLGSAIALEESELLSLSRERLLQLRTAESEVYDWLLEEALSESWERLERKDREILALGMEQISASKAASTRWKRAPLPYPNSPSLEGALEAVPVLCWATPETKREVTVALKPHFVPRGHALFLQGDKSQELYIVVSGEVCIIRESAEGEAQELATLSAGSLFGAGGFVAGQARSASAVAKSDAWLLSLNPQEAARLPQQAQRSLYEAVLTAMRSQLKAVNSLVARLKRSGNHVTALLRAMGQLSGWSAGDPKNFTGTQRYTPTRMLGSGGMGAVYEVQDNTSGERVALKVMLAQDPQRLLQFKQEFRVVAELHHKNLVRLFDLSIDKGYWFFTMELVHGHELLRAMGIETKEEKTRVDKPASTDDTLHKAPPLKKPERSIDLTRITDVVGQILDALEHLHTRGIIHRDLKPGNILLNQDGVVRLLDFGLTIQVKDSAFNQAGVEGTPAYMSPEQCRGEVLTPASDLYALGCILFQLLTGRLPFSGDPKQMMVARLTQPPPRVSRWVRGLPASLSELCDGLLRLKPTDRPSISEARRALGQPMERALLPVEKLPSVDREQEAALERHLVQTLEGRPQLSLLSGESTLAVAVEALAQRMGFLCLKGRCSARERVPFAALDRAMDALIIELSHWPKERLSPVQASIEALRTIFATMGALLPTRTEPALRVNSREQMESALLGFKALLLYCQRFSPLLFILDDLQWADEESISLLEKLFSEAEGRVMVLGLFHSQEIDPRHPLQRLLQMAERPQQAGFFTLFPEDASSE